MSGAALVFVFALLGAYLVAFIWAIVAIPFSGNPYGCIIAPSLLGEPERKVKRKRKRKRRSKP